jgi:hypothetical protein
MPLRPKKKKQKKKRKKKKEKKKKAHIETIALKSAIFTKS